MKSSNREIPSMDDICEVRKLPVGFVRRVCEYIYSRRPDARPYTFARRKRLPVWAPDDGKVYVIYMKAQGMKRGWASVTGRSSVSYADAKWKALWYMYAITSRDFKSRSPEEISLRLSIIGY